MGCGFFSSSSEQTQTRETGSLSPLGEEMLNGVYAPLLSDLLQRSGYDVSFETKEVYANPEKAESLEMKIADYDKQIADLTAQNTEIAARANASTGSRASLNEQIQKNQNNIDLFNRYKQQSLDQLSGIKKETIPDFTITKAEDIRVQDAIDKFGADSPQVQAARDQIRADEIFQVESEANVTRSYWENLQKFVNGDLSVTDEQRAQVDALVAPVKDSINQWSKTLMDKVGDDRDMMVQEINNLSDLINKTGFKAESALEAASLQVQKSGKTLTEVLSDVTQSNENKAKFELDLLYKKADEQASQQAAMLGLPPGSMAEREMATKIKTDALTAVRLDLAQDETMGRMKIEGMTQDKLNNISLAKVDLALSQGGRLENAQKTKINLLGDYAAKEQNIIANQGQQLTDLERTKSNQLFNTAYGNIPNMLNASAGGMMLPFQVAGAENALTNQALTPAANLYNQEYNRTLAESTTNTNTTSTPSMFDSLTKIGGATAGFGSMFTGGGTFGNLFGGGSSTTASGSGLGGSVGGGLFD